MNGVVLPFGSGDLGEPLGCQTRPLQGMCHDEVVEKRRILLPYLVLFVHYPLLHALVIHWVGQKKRR